MDAQLPPSDSIRDAVARALAEDVGRGDLTADLIPVEARAEARVISRQSAVICGTPWFEEVFAQLDAGVDIRWQVTDGERVAPDQLLCTLQGPARAILTGERTALNFLQALSGTATRARTYADAVHGLATRILDTRKTLPGLRLAQKYAVRCGGCHNHRTGLFDGILIKENHIAAAGSITAAVKNARNLHPDIAAEVEVENLVQLREALAAGAGRVLLDNFSIDELRAAVSETAGRATLEASGGIGLDDLRAIAETGVDFISVGSLTKDLQAVDLSMRFSLT
ncbi:MAG: carboxylating nicotinate-nucleotide diphosphorylase [Gammaproteobacteria bacterium]